VSGSSRRIVNAARSPVIGMHRRHSDVDDRDIRLVRPPLAHEVLGVARLRDYLKSGVPEQARDPLPQEQRILGQDYAHAIRAAIVRYKTAGATARDHPSELAGVTAGRQHHGRSVVPTGEPGGHVEAIEA
jgi:hypothetical protein